jgi:6-phosphogluconolactonase
VDASGRYLLAASYTSGNFQVFRIAGDGSIGTMTDNFQSVGNGTGPNPARQEGPHAHQILNDFAGHHVFGVDLGADKVNVWNLDLTSGKLKPNEVPFGRSHPVPDRGTWRSIPMASTPMSSTSSPRR